MWPVRKALKHCGAISSNRKRRQSLSLRGERRRPPPPPPAPIAAVAAAGAATALAVELGEKRDAIALVVPTGGEKVHCESAAMCGDGEARQTQGERQSHDVHERARREHQVQTRVQDGAGEAVVGVDINANAMVDEDHEEAFPE